MSNRCFRECPSYCTEFGLTNLGLCSEALGALGEALLDCVIELWSSLAEGIPHRLGEGGMANHQYEGAAS